MIQNNCSPQALTYSPYWHLPIFPQLAGILHALKATTIFTATRFSNTSTTSITSAFKTSKALAESMGIDGLWKVSCVAAGCGPLTYTDFYYSLYKWLPTNSAASRKLPQAKGLRQDLHYVHTHLALMRGENPLFLHFIYMLSRYWAASGSMRSSKPL